MLVHYHANVNNNRLRISIETFESFVVKLISERYKVCQRTELVSNKVQPVSVTLSPNIHLQDTLLIILCTRMLIYI